MAALKIIDRGDIPADKLAGSWAGAFGQTQFMPSSYLRLAAPGSDGSRDIVDSADDALSSTAHYFVKSGWRSGVPWGFEVRLPPGYSGPVRTEGEGADVGLGRARDRPDRRPAARRRRGRPAAARRRRGPGVPGDAQLRRRLFLQRRRILLRSPPACSQTGSPARQGIVAPWPTDDPGLSRAERRELQTLLARRGYDVGPPDGAIGAKTKEAIADFEGKVGLPVNGRASAKVLQALRQ